MFSCEVCGKRYASQYTLARHEQNHARNKLYTCTDCHVSYCRRDLLSRHLKIHQTASINTSVESNSSRNSRLRRHTACVRCAELKRKCGDGNPCVPCTQSNLPCIFPRMTTRVSRIKPNESVQGASASPGNEKQASDNVETQSVIRSPSDISTRNLVDADGIPFPPSPQVTRLSMETQSETSRLHDVAPMPSGFAAQVDSITGTATNQPWDVDSWAWMHESLYLQPQDQFWPDYADITDMFAQDMLGFAPSTVDASKNVTDMSIGSSVDSLRPRMDQSRGILGPSHVETGIARQTDHAVSSLSTESVLYESRQRLVEELASHAAMTNLQSSPSIDFGEYWMSMSAKVCQTFQIDILPGQSAMQNFIDLYLEHFWPLWPVVSKQNLDVCRWHPLLYLAIVSIGAMYGGTGSVLFGRMVHNKVRTYLTVAFELDDSDSDFIWLAQARLYTQVAALYFGQPKAFTYAQHLGALLIAQARRIELFSADQSERAYNNFMAMRDTGRDQERLALWLHLEARRRLAFGIFRADTYTSVLLETRPLLSLDEIDLSFPRCDAVWRASSMPIEACMPLIDHDRTPSRHLRASDIYHIAVDPAESLPPLDPVAYELLQFGLQRPLGRFGYDRSIKIWIGESHVTEQQRLNSSGSLCEKLDLGQSFDTPVHETSSVAARDIFQSQRLSIDRRKMSRLTRDHDTMLSSQAKWQEALPIVKAFVMNGLDRSSLMSGLVLFHLGYLRLHAPISKLHQVQYKIAEGRRIDPSLTSFLREWASSPSAKLAAQRSCHLYSLVAEEAFSTASQRVKFNLLAFIGLHHAAVILWSYIGLCQALSPGNEGFLEPMSIKVASHTILEVTLKNSEAILNAFVDLFYQISPGNWSSFAEAAAQIATRSFPNQSHTAS